MSSANNQIGVTETRHVDRISNLPDDVITERILSLLPTRDSVRTSALAARWRHLHASVPVLKFTDEPKHAYRTDPSAFMGVVSAALNSVTRLSVFHVCLPYAPISGPVVVSWIENAASLSVQRLHVHGCWARRARLPRCLFTCETLVSLSLDLRFHFTVPDEVRLPNLKSLWLKNLVFGDEPDDVSVRRLFSSCPVLEKLMVFLCSEPTKERVFIVSNPSLKELSLYLGHPRIELSINCPNLEKLICHSYATGGYSGDVFGSLKKCEIDVGLYGDLHFNQGRLIELVRQVYNVQFLSLAGVSMRSLLFCTGSLPTFKNLTHLELESATLIGWQLLPSILDSSPCLETLNLPKGFFDIDDHFGNPYSPPKHVPRLFLHLKVIKIGRFIGDEDEYEWVEYFLTNALVLKKMEICLWSDIELEEENDPVEVESESESEGEGEDDGHGEAEVNGEVEGEGEEEDQDHDQEVGGNEFERHFEISKRLLSYQRSSEVCQIVLTPHYD